MIFYTYLVTNYNTPDMKNQRYKTERGGFHEKNHLYRQRVRKRWA